MPSASRFIAFTLVVAAISLCARGGALASEATPRLPALFVVNAGSAVDTLTAWRAIVCEEMGADPDRAPSDSTAMHPVAPPVAIRSLVSSGAVIPLGDISYLFPRDGIYVLRDGHVIHTNPLASASLNHAHRYLDLDRRGMVLRRADETDAGSAPVPIQTTLRVEAECAVLRTMLGHTLEGSEMHPLSECELVVFQPEALSQALLNLQHIRAGMSLGDRVPITAPTGKPAK